MLYRLYLSGKKTVATAKIEQLTELEVFDLGCKLLRQWGEITIEDLETNDPYYMIPYGKISIAKPTGRQQDIDLWNNAMVKDTDFMKEVSRARLARRRCREKIMNSFDITDDSYIYGAMQKDGPTESDTATNYLHAIGMEISIIKHKIEASN